MISNPDLLARLVAACARRARVVALLGVLLGIAAIAFTVTHFSLTSDTEQLIAHTMPWRVREATFNRLFQPEGDQIVTVVDGATPEIAERAAALITARLQARPDLFHDVHRPDASPFFQREGLLYEDAATVRSDMAKLIAAQPFLGPIAADPSLRGLGGALTTATTGVTTGQATLDQLREPMNALAGAIEGVKAGKPTFFSWRALISGKTPPVRERRFIVLASPMLDFGKLLSGADASGYIRATAKTMNLDPAHGVRVRLTGPVPLQDEEFATLADRAALIGTLAVTAIIAMLWFAVRSVRLICAILLTMIVGLLCAMATGLIIFGRFNVISVAFIPLFVGLGIDFGIQFSVRFQSEHGSGLTVHDGIEHAGVGMGRSLALAATAIASGFLAFAPTDYVGVSQLGVIAGCGMFIALLLNLTLLPALIALLKPPVSSFAHSENRLLANIDAVVLRRRRWVLGGSIALAAACAALLPWLQV